MGSISLITIVEMAVAAEIFLLAMYFTLTFELRDGEWFASHTEVPHNYIVTVELPVA